MKITNLKWCVLLSIVALGLSACSSTGSTTVTPATRAVTQTPWIIYVPVTNTPEPATITPLPTSEVKTTPSRTATRAPVAVKPAATATKPAVVASSQPVATAAPACNLGTVTLKDPDNGALRQTKETGGTGGDTFRFIWDPPASLAAESSSDVGYQLEIASQRAGKGVNGANIYLSHNKFLRDGKIYIMDKPAVNALAGGADAVVSWKVTVIKASSGFNESDPASRPAGITICGPTSPIWIINLKVF